MCGICGIINYRNEMPVDRSLLERMTHSMQHRGPDASGLYLNGHVGFGHRRLSIIDIETGGQPMANEDKTIWIVFNGEIYNSPQLRTQMQQAGHKFSTASDTEVIIHAYEHFGQRCVDFLNGMFAFAIWDIKQKMLFVARDRVGIKPLFYAEINGAFLFGSELKTILANPNVPRRLDAVSLNQYLSFEYVPSPRSIIEGVRKLPPGYTLTLEKGSIRLQQYWDLRIDRSENGRDRRTEAVCALELGEILKESIRKELISDVSLGVLLSGGIDSSAVAAMMVAHCHDGIKSFSVANEDPSFDESGYARLVARHLGTEHHVMTLTSRVMLDFLPGMGEYMDEPLGDSSFVPTFLLAEFARRKVKVVLGGDGGDELFAGYPTLQAHKFFNYYQRLVPRALRNHLVPRIVNALPVSFDYLSLDFRLRRFVTGQGAPPAIRHHLWMGSFNGEQRALLLGAQAEGHMDDADEPVMHHLMASRARDPINQILYCDMKLFLEGDILSKIDRASMANSLEVRVPLLNPDMLAYVSGLPLRMKLGTFTTKRILRKAVEHLLPPRIIKRGKKGFNMPVAKWLTGPLRPLAEDMFSEERLKRRGLFNPAYVRQLMDEHLARRRDNRKLLWTLLAFELWSDRWLQ
jgi:asparagine synthase (glutamine-hydrolysing)